MGREWLENEFRRMTMVMPRREGYVNYRGSPTSRNSGCSIPSEGRREESTAVCRVLGQYPMEVFLDDLDVSTRIAMDGFWEMWVTMAIAKHVAPGSLCIDVGANVGYYTVLLAAVMDCEVQAWEPQRRVCGALDRTIRMNGLEQRVDVVQAAAGAKPMIATLHHYPNLCGSASLRGDMDTSSSEQVQVRTIDNETSERPYDFIKIDAEGYEADIIGGMLAVIQISPNLQVCMEWTPSKYANASDFFACLKGQFSVSLIEGAGDLKPATPEDETRLVNLPGGEFEMIWLRRLP
jgi:FkbM family methyltransferase